MSTSSFVAVIELTHPELALSHTIQSCPEMTIELDYQIIADPDTYYLFFEVSGGDFDAFDAAIADDPTVDESTVIIDGDSFRVYRMRLLVLERLVLPKAAELGMRVLHAEAGNGGWVATLQVPGPELLHQFRNHCVDRDVEFSVDRLYRTDGDERGELYGLTAPQRETLESAYRAGYFNEPRDASLEELADLLGVSSSAASGRLRRAVASLVRETLIEEP